MCFVNKKKWMFCGCCHLTTATVIWGNFLFVLAFARMAIYGRIYWLATANLPFGIACCLVVGAPHLESLRLFIIITFYVHLLAYVIFTGFLVYNIAFIETATKCGRLFKRPCDEYEEEFLILLGIHLVVDGIIEIILWQVVHGGRDEQIHYNKTHGG